MTNRRSLGRGLGSLIPDVKEEVKKDKNLVENLPVDLIRPRKGQPRKDFDEKSLEDLANSIKEYGLLNPITVTKVDNHYEILAGERRFRASRLNGSKTIEAIIKTFDNQDVEILSLIENVQREDLSAIEEATAYKKLIDSYGLTQEDIAKKMGKSRSYIANTIRLLKLADEEKTALKEGAISPSQARSLLSLDDEEKRKKALDDYKNKKAVVRDVEKISREDKKKGEDRKNYIDLIGKDDKNKTNKKKENKKEEEKLPNLDSLLFDDFEEKFMDKLDTKVRIEKSAETYKLVIDCYSIDDLEKIYDRIDHEA
ncbi:ParB/RepB/Spo0J family partition protein [uncultured Anaerococcus sp.]|uniref:ParB/RepB/Spo0J family partition protein n=1 Tax=uncultured Anaerococcus sp. TaxID=293428 RepID=UPI0025D26BB2|nr:ParB/RepB/Spo0J family partition protein [uncultured Anaerococcus sp.]